MRCNIGKSDRSDRKIKNSGSYGVALIIQRVKYSLVMKRKRTFEEL